jgi:hypothetical protein
MTDTPIVVHGTVAPPPQAGSPVIVQRHGLFLPGVVSPPPQAKTERIQMRAQPYRPSSGGMGLGS